MVIFGILVKFAIFPCTFVHNLLALYGVISTFLVAAPNFFQKFRFLLWKNHTTYHTESQTVQ